MRISWLGPLSVVLLMVSAASGQYEGPAESVSIHASKAFTWVEEPSSVVMLEGPVTIEVDQHRMTAQQAVVWITPLKGTLTSEDHVEIALVGDAVLTQPNGVERSGPRLFVDARVRGPIRFDANQRIGGDRSDNELYKLAASMRPVLLPGQRPGEAISVQEEAVLPATQPTTREAYFRPVQRVEIITERFQTITTPEGTVAVVMPGKVQLLQRAEDGSLLELQADRAVVFTPIKSLLGVGGGPDITQVEQAVTGVYLDGDVRIVRTPADPRREPEQSLSAQRAFYDFTTDRAVLTDVVLHTTDPATKMPITVRAQTVRQLARTETITEYRAEKARLSTSSFHTPSYSIGASSAYIRQQSTADELAGMRTTFVAKNATFDLGKVPVFYLPIVGGTVPDRLALRNVEVSSSKGFGFGVSTEWGLFESLGRRPPKDLDLSYLLDYYSDRGPAVGLRGKYEGGYIDESTREPWSFAGDLTSYLVWDSGTDDLGRQRNDVEPDDEMRGRFYWRHQHFFPNDWQVQLTAGYVSDPSFMEEWFNDDFRSGQPLQTSFYAKRQRDTEAFTFLATVQPNDFVTVADFYQEQFEIERIPEIGYRRIGDSFMQDNLTFFSANTLSAVRFHNSDADLAEIGFAKGSPGLPAQGEPYDLTHGTPRGFVDDDTTYRGDFRQEIDWPFSLGRFRAVPYVVGRYSNWSQSVDSGSLDRLYMGAGVRMTTAFWKVDDTVQSRLFDLHRLRHVIEPEANLFAGAMGEDRSDILIYDEPIDAITDISAVQAGLRQRWQTKRGGPGNWRSVDVFTLNAEVVSFFSQPPDRELHPEDFRGIYYVSTPEASIARNAVNVDGGWQVSDNVQITGETSYNTDENNLATAGVGLSVRQAPRLSYHVGLRHIGIDLSEVVNGRNFIFREQDLFIFGASYRLTPKYTFQVAHSYDFAIDRTYRSTVGLIRRFDRFYVMVSLRTDKLEQDNAFFVNVWPEGMQPGGGSRALRGAFEQ